MTQPRLSRARLCGLFAAAAVGVWLGRRIGPAGSLMLAGVVLAALPGRRSSRTAILPVEGDDDSVWPKAPVAPPFVPHTRAWDDLRAALSPVSHAPGEEVSLEATDPFIVDDPTDEPLFGALPPPPPMAPRTLLD